MSDWPEGSDWWKADDGRWYPPEQWTGPPGTSPPSNQSTWGAPTTANGTPVAGTDPASAVADTASAATDTASAATDTAPASTWGAPDEGTPAWGAPADGAPAWGAPAGGAAGVAGGGGGGAPARKGPSFNTRPSRRFTGRGLLVGFGLLSILLTVGIMALLSGRVLDGVTGSGEDDSGEAEDLLSTIDSALDSTVPGAPTTAPAASTAPAPAEIDPGLGGQATQAGGAAVCAANKETIELAAQAYELTSGAPPGSLEELVNAGLLDPEVSGFTVSASGGTVVVTGVDQCAGT